MARMKREEWYDIARDVDWTLSYVDEEAAFPEWMTGAGKIPREAWKSWMNRTNALTLTTWLRSVRRKARCTRSRPLCSAPTFSRH